MLKTLVRKQMTELLSPIMIDRKKGQRRSKGKVIAFALLFMAAALMVCLFVKWPSIPEFWQGLGNRGPEVGVTGQNIFPCLFITVACGALSGFHSTQSPLMSRCLTDERQGRPVFYGAMITEGIVALVWAAVSSYFFFDGGMQAVGASSGQAPEVVSSVAQAWLGITGGILAIIGVVAAPITSGDTAFRCARVIIADFLHINQKKKKNRILIALPLFAAASLLLWYNIADESGFNTIWRYFGLANQALASLSLWTFTVFLNRKYSEKAYYLISLIPACFITAVCVTYVCVDKLGFNLPDFLIPYIGIGVFLLSLVIYHFARQRAISA